VHGYKIGRAKVLKNRLSQFGLVLPFEVKLIHALKSSDMARTEWYFHDHFKERRIQGEWFDLSDRDLAFFCDAGTERGMGEAWFIEPTLNLTPYKLVID
jgi:hypothetical protein